jgi:hypothetical protein
MSAHVAGVPHLSRVSAAGVYPKSVSAAVDPQGNQLPYLIECTDVQDPKILGATGPTAALPCRTATFAFRLHRADEPAAIQWHAHHHWYPASRSVCSIRIRTSDDPDDPTTKFKAELLSDKHFR